MSHISTPAVAAATGAAAELFSRIKKMAGSVPNTYAAISSLQPAALDAMLDAEAVLAAGSLSKQDIETVKLTVTPPPDAAIASRRTAFSASWPGCGRMRSATYARAGRRAMRSAMRW